MHQFMKLYSYCYLLISFIFRNVKMEVLTSQRKYANTIKSLHIAQFLGKGYDIEVCLLTLYVLKSVHTKS